MSYATYVRRLQFTAGPQSEDFHACEQHKWWLERGNVDLFFATVDEPVRPFDVDMEIECWFCRGEEGP